MILFNPLAVAFDLFQTGLKMTETLVATQSVLAARTPILWAACQSPLTADHHELGLMVTEKMDAFGKAARHNMRGADKLKSVMDANARDLGRLTAGTLFWPTDWWKMAERNWMATSALMALPGTMLAPIHKGVTANARRLRR